MTDLSILITNFFDFRFYTWPYSWLYFTMFILYIVSILVTVSVARNSRSRAHYYLILALFGVMLLVVSNVNGSRIDHIAGVQDFFYTNCIVWGNRIGWLFLALVGFEIVKNTDKDIPRVLIVLFWLNNIINFVLTFYRMYFVTDYYTENVFVFDPFRIYVFHFYSFVGAMIFLYCVWVTKPLNKRGTTVKWLWHIGISSWVVYYIVNFVFLLAGTHLDVIVLLTFYVLSTFVLFYLIIFIPENLFIFKNIMVHACHLYARVHTTDSKPISLTYGRLKEYITTIPEDIWTDICHESSNQ